MTRRPLETSPALGDLDHLLATGRWPDDEASSRKIIRIIIERAHLELREQHPRRRRAWIETAARQAEIARHQTAARATLARMVGDARDWLRLRRRGLREE